MAPPPTLPPRTSRRSAARGPDRGAGRGRSENRRHRIVGVVVKTPILPEGIGVRRKRIGGDVGPVIQEQRGQPARATSRLWRTPLTSSSGDMTYPIPSINFSGASYERAAKH